MMVEAADFSAVSEYDLPQFWNYILTCAAVHGRNENIPFLLERGAQTERQHPFLREYATPLGFAASRGYTDTVRLLLREGANVDAGMIRTIQYASRIGFARTMELLLDQGATLTLNSSLRVLEETAEYGRYNTAKVFLDRGLHLVPGRFDNGELALEFAKVYEHEPLVRLLREYGVSEED
jgi:ankyrin repeat protein